MAATVRNCMLIRKWIQWRAPEASMSLLPPGHGTQTGRLPERAMRLRRIDLIVSVFLVGGAFRKRFRNALSLVLPVKFWKLVERYRCKTSTSSGMVTSQPCMTCFSTGCNGMSMRRIPGASTKRMRCRLQVSRLCGTITRHSHSAAWFCDFPSAFF